MPFHWHGGLCEPGVKSELCFVCVCAAMLDEDEEDRVDEIALRQLTEMGFPESRAVKALRLNQWVFQHLPGTYCLCLTQICIFFVPLYGSRKWRLEKVLTPRSAASGGVQVAQGRGIGAGCALQGLWVTGLPGWHCFQVSNSHFLQLSKSDFTEEKANLAHPHWPFSCRNILCADL